MSIAPDLFPAEQLLEWLPGETLFSLLSRQHQLSGFFVSARTSERFFGIARAGSQHDFPNRLTSLIQRTNGQLGTLEEIASKHTLLAFYRAFMPSEECAYAIECMAGNSVAHLKLRLGILTSRFRAHHPLKACPECMQEDVLKTGWAYWHLEHQYPGVWACTKHSRLLLASTLKATGVHRFQWTLPRLEELTDENDFNAQDNAQEMPQHRLLSLARLIEALVQTGANKPLSMPALYLVYRDNLASRGWITKSGSLRMNEISKEFLQHAEPLRLVYEFQGLPRNTKEAFAMLGRMLRPPRTGTHPLRHIVMIDWLFDGAAPFYEAYRCLERKITSQVPDVVAEPKEDSRRIELHKLLTIDKLSARAAAQAMSIDTQTVLMWARQMGLNTPTRAKKMSTALTIKVVSALRKGVDKKEVVRQSGLSESTVNRVLLSDRDLHQAWQAARVDQARQRARQAWLALLDPGQDSGVKWMRTLEPQAYAWLYRNDRVWLNAHKPTAVSVRDVAKKSAVDWSSRDVQLSAEVRRVALRLLIDNKVNHLFFWQLYQHIPELKAKRSVLHRLPLTRAAIDDVLKAKSPLEAGLWESA